MEYKRTIIQLPQRTMSNFLFFVVLYIVAITFNNNKSVPTLNYPNNKIHPPPQKKDLLIQFYTMQSFTSKKQHYLANFMSPLDGKAYQVHFLSQF